MDQATHNKVVSFIWGIADDVLRDLFKRGKYPDVILPMCVIRRMDAETFRRICMSFDGWVVGFGFSRVVMELGLMASPWAYSIIVVTIAIDVCLLITFFSARRAAIRDIRRPRWVA